MVLLSVENLVLQAMKGALCTLDSNRIIWPYLECGAGVFNKETASNILMFGFYGKEVLTHLFYDEIYYKNSTSVCNGAFPIITGVSEVFLPVSEM